METGTVQTADAALAELARAIAAEIKFGFSNLQGRKARFADFALEQALALRSADRLYQDGTFAHLLAQLEGYADLAEPERRARLERARKLLLPHLRAGELRAAWEEELLGKKPKQARPPADPDDWEEAPVQSVKGVGAKFAEDLAKAGIETVGQLLRHYPRKHLDYSARTRIRELREGMEVTIWGEVRRSEVFSSPRNPKLTIHNVTIGDGSGTIKLCWFYGKANKYLQDQYKARFPAGSQVLVSGTVKRDSRSRMFTLDKPEAELLGDYGEESGSLHLGRIVPVYPLVAGLSLKHLRRAMAAAIQRFLPKLADPLPAVLRQANDLVGLAEALREFHFPSSAEKIVQARTRLVFDELFYMQLGLAFRRERQNAEMAGLVLVAEGPLMERFLALLPFTLTGAQQRAVAEIAKDLSSGLPMNRLLQGDVGSGKTVVAVMALLAAVQHGYQGALMAPTEVLTGQHFRKLREWLTPLGIAVELLVGGQRAAERRRILKAVASGDCPVVVGTHALIQDKVEFQRLGLVIIDEQHRFGVEQRARLRAKGDNPQVLTMSATPIPRTLALTLHGDLDLSTIDELPPGRQPVLTELVTAAVHRRKVWELVRNEVAEGRQAYVVYPLIEESEKVDLRAATVEYERLRESFSDLRVGLMHGRLSSAEKEAVIGAFRRQELDILVSTTVIEVGVDVPNATVMVIADAERFGLSQLHQLRGRVGRGADRSYCFLAPGKLGDASRERLEVLVSTNDGFVIAEQDLRLRGPGEFLGTRQSGLADFVLADLVADAAVLEAARAAARELAARDPQLAAGRHALLRRELARRWRDRLDWLGLT